MNMYIYICIYVYIYIYKRRVFLYVLVSHCLPTFVSTSIHRGCYVMTAARGLVSERGRLGTNTLSHAAGLNT